MGNCPEGKIRNPKTGRCVKANGAIGKKLLANQPQQPLSGFDKETEIKYSIYEIQGYGFKYKHMDVPDGKLLVKQHITKIMTNKIDNIWFKDMDKYLRSLTTYDVMTLYGYTNHSQSWINAYLNDRFMTRKQLKKFTTLFSSMRYFPWYVQMHKLISKAVATRNMMIDINGKRMRVNEWIATCSKLSKSDAYDKIMKIIPYMKDEFLGEVCKLVASDLTRIIKGAPPLNKDLVVYRGEPGEMDKEETKGYISCTLNRDVAQRYMRKNTCCMKRIVIPAGTRCLFLEGVSAFPKDFEILLDKNTKMSVTKVHEITHLKKGMTMVDVVVIS